MGKFIEPGIEKIGTQHYRVWWTERGTGRRPSRVVRGPLSDARILRASMLDSQSRGVYVAMNQMRVDEYLDLWMLRREALGTTQQTTDERYRSLLASVKSRLGDMALQDLTKEQIEGYYVWCLRNEHTNRKTLVSKDTVHKRHKVLKAALADAVEDGLIVRNPAQKAKHPAAARPHGQAFSAEEAQRVMAALYGSWVEIEARIALHAGLRIGEIMALRWSYMDLPAKGRGRIVVAGSVTETKSGYWIKPFGKTSHARRTVSIGPALTEMLRSHRKAQAERRLSLGVAWEDNDLVVCGLSGQLLRPSKVSARFTPIISMLEDEGELSTHGATFHSLRHTHATLLLADGAKLHVVSKRLGHSRIQITIDYYGHVIPADDEAVADSFDDVLSGRPDDAVHMDCTREAAFAASDGAE